MERKPFLTALFELVYDYRPKLNLSWREWLPTKGNVVFTLLVIASLLWAQNVGAISLGAPIAATASITGIPYQGRLADKNGAPLTQTVNMTFRLYAAVSGGAPLWEEAWTGANSVQVSDGLFNVMLGSLAQIPQTVITGNSNLFLGITVGTDSEMSPRVQLGSVPFATLALTVPDGSITAAKLANDLIQAYSASTNTEYWTVAQCGKTDNHLISQYQSIPGLQLNINSSKSRKVLINFSGIGKNPGAGESIYTNIVIDNNLASAASGAPLLSGCTNSNVSGNPWCTLANSTTLTLTAGAHAIDVRVFCDGTDADAQVYSGSLYAVVLP